MSYFDGQLDVESFLDWIKQVEDFFECMNIPRKFQVKLVKFKLKGGAAAWWDQLNLNGRKMGKKTVKDWENMKKMLKPRFLSYNYEQILYQSYQECRQHNRLNARNYFSKFE